MAGGLAVTVDAQLGEPQHEAAFFYGLFLRGQPLQRLREDIDVPPQVLERWKREASRDPWNQFSLDRIVSYRKHVLAIFDSLIFQEMATPERIQ